MSDRSLGIRASAASMAVVMVMTCGCARPLPPPSSYAEVTPDLSAGRLAVLPVLVVDEKPMRFVGLTAAQRKAFAAQRETFEAERDKRVEARKDKAVEAEAGKALAQCVIQTLIIFAPLCIIIVPLTLGAVSGVEGRKAARQDPYLPELPSEAELARVDKTVRQHLGSAAIASQLTSDLNQLKARGYEGSHGHFPRLLIRTDSATFTPDRVIVIDVVVQLEAGPELTLEPTAHRYHLGYHGESDRRFLRGLSVAGEDLAYSILRTYGLFKDR